MSYTIEMFWNCPACGHKKNPGMTGVERESLRCVTCGYEKKESDQWLMPYSPELQPHLTGNLDAKARAGANWTCKYCGGESRAGHSKCEICGAVCRTHHDGKQFVDVVPVAASAAPATTNKHISTTLDSLLDEAMSKAVDAGAREKIIRDDEQRRDRSNWIYAISTMVGVALICGLIAWLVTPRETNVRVTDVHWYRAETLQERHDYDGEGWQDQEPSDVFQESCQSRQRGTHNCNPHDCNCRPESYECNCSGGDSYSCNCRTSCSSNRNGSATCSESCSTCYTPRRCSTCSRTVCSTCYDQCPTFVNWCVYRFHRWDTMAHHELARHDVSPEWPVPLFVAQHSLQRVTRDENYHVVFSDDEEASKTWDELFPSNRFVQFRMRQHWHILYSHAGRFELLRQLP